MFLHLCLFLSHSLIYFSFSLFRSLSMSLLYPSYLVSLSLSFSPSLAFFPLSFSRSQKSAKMRANDTNEQFRLIGPTTPFDHASLNNLLKFGSGSKSFEFVLQFLHNQVLSHVAICYLFFIILYCIFKINQGNKLQNKLQCNKSMHK